MTVGGHWQALRPCARTLHAGAELVEGLVWRCVSDSLVVDVQDGLHAGVLHVDQGLAQQAAADGFGEVLDDLPPQVSITDQLNVLG